MNEVIVKLLLQNYIDAFDSEVDFLRWNQILSSSNGWAHRNAKRPLPKYFFIGTIDAINFYNAEYCQNIEFKGSYFTYLKNDKKIAFTIKIDSGFGPGHDIDKALIRLCYVLF